MALTDEQRAGAIAALTCVLKSIGHIHRELSNPASNPGDSERVLNYEPHPAEDLLRDALTGIGQIIAPEITHEELRNLLRDVAESAGDHMWYSGILNFAWDDLKTSDGWIWAG